MCGQAISSEIEGAYTGQTSAKMLKNIGCAYTLIGHSERRCFETEESIKNQISRAIEQQITPVLCVGESLAEKKNQQTSESLLKQIEHCLTHDEKEKIIVAYEPKWAIGSGLTPSIDEIKMILNLIRSHIGNKVLYGGSVNLDNYSDILKSGVDGLLIGGLSLSYQKLIQIVNGPSTMNSILFTFHFIICIALILLILAQQGKGSEMGVTFSSGSSSSVFGSKGSSAFLVKLTTFLACVFFLIA